MIVFVKDSGLLFFNSSIVVIVIIKDVNDNKLIFFRSVYFEKLVENLRLGIVIMILNVIDDDSGNNGNVIYKIDFVF